MMAVVEINSVIAGIGFLLNITVFFLVLFRGNKLYHYLFAGILLICAVWDLGVLVSMLRNEFPQELVLVGYMATIPAVFLLPLFFQFTCSYLDRPMMKTSLLLWIIAAEAALFMSAGKFGHIIGVNAYVWGNFWQGDKLWQSTTLVWIFFYCTVLLAACGMVIARFLRPGSHNDRRELVKILLGFLALMVAIMRILPSMGEDSVYLLPVGILLNDVFLALIGVSIVNHQLSIKGVKSSAILEG
jgi:hypothetical protein